MKICSPSFSTVTFEAMSVLFGFKCGNLRDNFSFMNNQLKFVTSIQRDSGQFIRFTSQSIYLISKPIFKEKHVRFTFEMNWRGTLQTHKFILVVTRWDFLIVKCNKNWVRISNYIYWPLFWSLHSTKRVIFTLPQQLDWILKHKEHPT